MVLYLGRVEEMADRNAIYNTPQHPYTTALLSAVPIPDPHLEVSRKRLQILGELASPLDPRAGLRFLPSRLTPAADYQPRLEEIAAGHFVEEHDPLDALLKA